MFERLRLALHAFRAEMWDGADETASLYCRARHAAAARLAASPLPQPDKGVIERMAARDGYWGRGDKLTRIRLAGY